MPFPGRSCDRGAARRADVFGPRGPPMLQPRSDKPVFVRLCSLVPLTSSVSRRLDLALRGHGRRRLARWPGSRTSRRIMAESPDIVELPAAHGREHSLEMQMPFVAHLFPGVPIVPLVMGRQTRDTAFALAAALARAAASRAPDVLLVASTDLSHYEDASTALALDEIVIRRVEAMDPHGLMDALEAEPRHACGGGPMVACSMPPAAGATEARL